MATAIQANNAPNTNPPAGDEYLSENGSNWLWAVTALYFVSFIAVFSHSFFARSGEKIFHYLFTIALLVGTISYFAQASDLGWSLVVTERSDVPPGSTRQIFFVKYINWAVAYPVTVIALGLISGVSWATIIYNVLLSWIWDISYLCCAYTATRYKWGFYGFGTAAMCLLLVNLGVVGFKGAKRVGTTRDHLIIYQWFNILCCAYAPAMGVTDAGNRMGVTGMFIFIGILDLLLTPALAFVFLIMSRRWNYSNLNIAFTQYGRVPAHPNAAFPKNQTAPGNVPTEAVV